VVCFFFKLYLLQYSVLHYSVGGYWLDVFGHHPNGLCLNYEEQTRSAQESILHKVLVAKQHEAYVIIGMFL